MDGGCKCQVAKCTAALSLPFGSRPLASTDRGPLCAALVAAISPLPFRAPTVCRLRLISTHRAPSVCRRLCRAKPRGKIKQLPTTEFSARSRPFFAAEAVQRKLKRGSKKIRERLVEFGGAHVLARRLGLWLILGLRRITFRMKGVEGSSALSYLMLVNYRVVTEIGFKRVALHANTLDVYLQPA